MNMKKILTTLVLLLLILSCSNPASSNDNNHALLWKITGKGLENPSYLFGTHHLVPVSFLDSITGLEAALESSGQIVGEIDMSHMAEMQMKIMKRATLPEGVTYASLLSTDDLQLLEGMLTSLFGAGLDQFGTLRPAMLNNMIVVTLYQKYYPSLSSKKSLDQYFQEEAHNRSLPVQGLETTEDQIHLLLEQQSPERQAEMLICMIRHPEMLKEQMDEIHAAYYAQDLDALWKIYSKESPDDPCPSTAEEKNALNRERNKQWLKKLPALMEERSSFIAVGSLHLPGEEGLIDGLRSLGYRVEPVL